MEWIKKHKVWTAIIAVTILGVLGIPLQDAETSDTSESSAVEVVQDSVVLEDINYAVLEENDVSFSGTSRLSSSLVIKEDPATEEQIKVVSEYYIDQKKDDNDAISLSFYFNEYQLGESYTLAQAEWAPYGEWSRADEGENQELNYTFKSRVGESRIDAPSDEEFKINSAQRSLFFELSENSADIITDEQVAEQLAKEYGKTAEEMLEIRKKVSDYNLGI